MVTQKPKAKLTYEDYAKTPEGERWELINGELINGEYGMAPSAREAHQRNQMQIGSRMFLFSDENNLGRVYSEFDVVLSDTDTVRPDLIFISEERLHIITVDNVQGAPDLVVEIRSPSTARQDWTVKRELYARHGVKEYWLVDPEAATVSLLLLDDGKLTVAGVFGEKDTLTSNTLEGFTIALADIFRG
jgi:Uma2 family endonuclease